LDSATADTVATENREEQNQSERERKELVGIPEVESSILLDEIARLTGVGSVAGKSDRADHERQSRVSDSGR
jgi:hypothetical protein